MQYEYKFLEYNRNNISLTLEKYISSNEESSKLFEELNVIIDPEFEENLCPQAPVRVKYYWKLCRCNQENITFNIVEQF